MFKHRIIGIVNFDVPLLGLHPGVVSAGLGSLFRPKAKSPNPQTGNNGSQTDTTEAITDTLTTTTLHDSSSSSSFLTADPNFNPNFPNDVRLKNRSQLDGALHFIMKHSDHLVKATREYVSSHIEFGSCLADYPALKDRYRRIRALEDIDEYARKRDAHGRPLRRVRFVNYYTASTGFIKPDAAVLDKQSHEPNHKSIITTTSEEHITALDVVSTPSISQSTTTLASVEPPSESNFADSPPDYETSQAYHESSLESDPLQENSTSQTPNTSLEETENDHVSKDADDVLSLQNTAASTSLAESLSSLPPLPPLPEEPATFDPSQYPDKDTLKLAQKEHSRQVKGYERAKKDREKALKDREKLLKKREKAAAKEAAKEHSSQQQIAQKTESTVIQEITIETPMRTPPPLPPRESNTSITTTTTATSSSNDQDPTSQNDSQKKSPPELPPRKGAISKSKKDRKFCTLPSKDADGTRDPLWVRVYMEGIDEVVAHQSLFIPNNNYYEKLVGDTAARIQDWVQEEQTRRMILEEMEGLN